MATDNEKSQLRKTLGELADESKWLTLMRYAMATLVNDQTFLAELTEDRLNRELRASDTHRLAPLLSKLSLRLHEEPVFEEVQRMKNGKPTIYS